jgi:3-phosphoglycerate kinase
MNYNKKSVTDVDVNGKRVLIRCELNAPQDEHGNVTDATRIVTAVPTVKYLAENGAKVIIITHLGRPKGKVVPSLTVAPIAKEMEKCETMLYNVLAENMEADYETIKNMCDRDFWMTPEEAVKFKVIDEIIKRK